MNVIISCKIVAFRGVDGDIVSNEFCFAHSNKTPTWSCAGDLNNENKRCQSSSQQFFDRAVRGIDLAFTAKSAEAVEGVEVPVGLSNFTYALTDPGNIGEIKWDITLCLLLSWVVCFGCLVKGIKSSGKVEKCKSINIFAYHCFLPGCLLHSNLPLCPAHSNHCLRSDPARCP